MNVYSDITYSDFENIIFPIRKDFLKIAEDYREKRIIGKSEELGTHITWYCENKIREFNSPGPIWRGELFQTMLKSSWVVMSWEYSEQPLHWKLDVWDLKEDDSFRQCPRCFLFHLYKYSDGTIKETYDNLCNRCMKVMLGGYADHPTMDKYFEDRPELAHTRYIKL